MGCSVYSFTQKKTLYVNTALMSVIVLLGIAIHDLLEYIVFERTDRTSQTFTESLLLIHVMSYYTALLGFVYNTKAGKRMAAAKLEWLAVVTTFLLTITRVSIEVGFLTYRNLQYKNFND